MFWGPVMHGFGLDRPVVAPAVPVWVTDTPEAGGLSHPGRWRATGGWVCRIPGQPSRVGRPDRGAVDESGSIERDGRGGGLRQTSCGTRTVGTTLHTVLVKAGEACRMPAPRIAGACWVWLSVPSRTRLSPDGRPATLHIVHESDGLGPGGGLTHGLVSTGPLGQAARSSWCAHRRRCRSWRLERGRSHPGTGRPGGVRPAVGVAADVSWGPGP